MTASTDRSADAQAQALIVTLGRRFLGTARDDEALARLDPPLDWVRLAELAAQEGMSGLVADGLLRLAAEYGIRTPCERWQDTLHRVFASSSAALADLDGLRRLLREAGQQAIVLKGAALITEVYGGRRALRSLSDVDLLVRPTEVAAVIDLLCRRGFRRPTPGSSLLTRGGPIFDVHTDLVGAGRIRCRARAVRFDPGRLWAQAVPLDDRDPTLLTLAPEHQLLHLAVHTLKHAFGRMIWIVDLALVFRRVDVVRLLDEAQASGSMRILSYALTVSQQMLGLEIPPALASRLPAGNALERWFVRRVVARKAPTTAGELLLVCSIAGLGDRLSYLREVAFPRFAILTSDLGSAPAWRLYLRRLRRMVTLAWEDAIVRR